MRIAISKQACRAIVAGLFAATAVAGSAQATVYLPTPSLPLIGAAYISPSGAGCFLVGTVCVTPGTFIQTSIVSSTFSGGNQVIEADATYSGAVSGALTGPVTLTGTVYETVMGRSSDTQTGPFTTDITSLSLSGVLMLSPSSSPLNGHTLEVTLNTAKTSDGTTTITPDGPVFRIDSFFDVFIDISLEGTGLSTTLPDAIHLVAVPETSTWAMLLVGFAGLGFAARRVGRGAVSMA